MKNPRQKYQIIPDAVNLIDMIQKVPDGFFNKYVPKKARIKLFFDLFEHCSKDLIEHTVILDVILAEISGNDSNLNLEIPSFKKMGNFKERNPLLKRIKKNGTVIIEETPYGPPLLKIRAAFSNLGGQEPPKKEGNALKMKLIEACKEMLNNPDCFDFFVNQKRIDKLKNTLEKLEEKNSSSYISSKRLKREIGEAFLGNAGEKVMALYAKKSSAPSMLITDDSAALDYFVGQLSKNGSNVRIFNSAGFIDFLRETKTLENSGIKPDISTNKIVSELKNTKFKTVKSIDKNGGEDTSFSKKIQNSRISNEGYSRN